MKRFNKNMLVGMTGYVFGLGLFAGSSFFPESQERFSDVAQISGLATIALSIPRFVYGTFLEYKDELKHYRADNPQHIIPKPLVVSPVIEDPNYNPDEWIWEKP